MWPFGSPKSLGERGEQIARRFLARQGAKVLARNYRCPAGEIDLIVLDRSQASPECLGTVAFVEVKTRTDDAATDPESAVHGDKRHHVRRAAAYYLATHDCSRCNTRFDIVSVVLPPRGRPRVKHIADAFQ